MPTKFVVIRNPEMLHQLSNQNAEIMGAADRDPFYGAPVAILVLVDSTVHTWVEDGSLAMGAMLNAAYAVGLGSCWIHRARETFDSEAGNLSRRGILYSGLRCRRTAAAKAAER